MKMVENQEVINKIQVSSDTSSEDSAAGRAANKRS